jgi:hypothetical protein
LISANLTTLASPGCLGIHDEVMPLFMIKHFVIPFNLDHPKCDTSEEVPNLDFLDKLLGILSPRAQRGFAFPIEVVKVARLNPTKLMHEGGGPLPTLRAWVQSQNLCSTNPLVLGGKSHIV